ncbi:threonine--tRNA ligase [candidate division WWE3 bacterium RIFOXYC1_FULL_39_7]|uniref:Threonine--tRNA ligase n=2 Tax=Katanobacteria TaxID=422282 RepID=A0A1F4X8W8_UNCKA|nr:MAG: threonine--tRNA ligase [candidate division WWE3 bacterium RIFOXYC1_FULL_39_7]OGC78112.1 MAG: threonine--tRNA ligase [candidate division WWE3 bacterium RIFOXYD1_FULL_39_9]
MSAKEKVIEKLKDDPQMPLRHTAEHILHMSMQELYPNLKKVMGPPIEDGFYFDFDLDEKISPEDFPKIEQRMQEIIDAKLPIKRSEITQDEAKKIFKDNEYKMQWLGEITDRNEKISIYETGTAGDKHYDLDLCAGPHVDNTSKVKAFKLLSLAGAYWKGSEKNKMLQRIYATAFADKKDLDTYLNNLEEAKKRDHRKLGSDLFVISEDVGAGLVLWTPNGAIIREELENWAKETEEAWGYQRVATPHIAKHTLYETSGHLPYYKDDMYAPMIIDDEEYYLKGMNCPHHHIIYNAQPKSYRDLPVRYAEYGMVYRFEDSGALFGLMRVRSICQNDAHIYCTIEQAEEEFLKTLELYDYYYKTLGLSKDDYYAVIGLPSEEKRNKYHGDKATWDLAEKITRSAVKKFGIHYEEDVGGAAFYGPKIDINIKSSIGKEYAISTAQLDLYMPTRFNLEYTDKDGSKKLVAVIHRAPLGSHERFIGFLIEHFAGAFPVWLSPVQVMVVPIGEKHVEYAQKVAAELKANRLRVSIDDRNDTMQSKIRDAQMKKIPYMLIVGDREAENEAVSVRLRTGEDLKSHPLKEVCEKINEIRLTKSLHLW